MGKYSITRQKYMDSIKGLAMILVFSQHFVTQWHQEYMSLWDGFLLNGLTGKCGVAIFGVILGYYARKSSKKVLEATLSRYIYFVICGIVINVTIVLLSLFNATQCDKSFFDAVISAIKLKSDVFPTFWFLLSFFVASFISYLNSEMNAGSIVMILEIIIFYVWTRQVWVIICLLGNLAYVICETDEWCAISRNKYIQCAFVVMFFILCKQPESDIVYFVDGLFALSIVVAIYHIKSIQIIGESKILNVIGRNSMAFLMVHVLVYTIIGRILFKLIHFELYAINFLAVGIACFTICVIISVPLDYVLRKASSLISKNLFSIYEDLQLQMYKIKPNNTKY